MSKAGINVSFATVVPEDKVPLPPPDAKIYPTACDYCVVGCAYRAIVWPVGKEGGPKANQNAYGVDFPITEAQAGNWATPEQHTIVLKDGEPHHCIVIPAISERVNRSGNHSIRGGNIAQKCYSPVKPTSDRLQTPLMRVRNVLVPISWEDATTITAEVGKYVLDKYDELAYGAQTFSYQFWENTYAITKLLLQSIETPCWAHHDKPSAQGDAVGMEDAGIDTFGSAYEDFKLAEVIYISGADPYENQTIMFTEWIMDGGAKLINALPRKSTGAAYGEKNGGLFLQVIPGTDPVLNNAMCRVIIENGWEDKEFIAKWCADDEEIDWGMGRGVRNTPWQWRTTRWGVSFAKWKDWLLKDEFTTLEYAEKTTGVPRAKIVKAAEMLTGGGKGPRPKASFLHEKGNYWSNNYLSSTSFCNLGLICGAGTKPGQRISRCGGHQRGGMGAAPYPITKTPQRFGRIGRLAMDVDRWILSNNLRFLWVIGAQKLENSCANGALHDYFRQHVTLSPHQIDSTDPKRAIEVLKARVDNQDIVCVNSEIYLRTFGNQYADIVMPAATWGEEDFTRAQGERVMRIYSKFYDPPGDAKPDWWIISQVAKKMGFEGYNWKSSQDVFKEAARFSRGGILEYAPLLPYAKLKGKEPYELLRERGAMGYQTPLRLHDGELIETKRTNDETAAPMIETPQGISTMQKRLSGFTRPSGKALLHKVDWKLYKDFHEAISPKKEKGELWVTNGRVNEIWQSVFDDMRKPYIMQRYPMNFVEIHPEDAKARGIENGDIVSMENDEVFVQTGGFYFLRDSDALFTSLMKNGHIKTTKGSATAMAIVTDAVQPGLAYQYFLWPGASGNALAHNVPDPITNAPRYKTGKAVIKKIGTLPDRLKARITWANKNAV